MNTFSGFFLGLMLSLSVLESRAECMPANEYDEFRVNFYRKAKKNYELCKSSVYEYYFWLSVAECKHKEKENCYHMPRGSGNDSFSEKVSHCDALRPSVKEIKKWFFDEVLKSGIKECEAKNSVGDKK